MTFRLDGSPAAATTITRKRAILHGALAYAAETGLLEANPADHITWHPPKAVTAIDSKVVVSPVQARALLAAVTRIRPDQAAFFGCLYYAALRPEEAVALRVDDCRLPGRGWGLLTLTRAAPRTGAAWTSTGTAARTTCATPPCPCGLTQALTPPRSPAGPGIASPPS